MNITKGLCQIILDTTFDTLPCDAVKVAKQMILDGISVAVAGSIEAAPRIMAEHIQTLGENPIATALGLGFKTSSVSATAINGISMHVLDYEPMWSPPTHATSPTLPTVLALAEMEAATGRDVITAFVKGCEIQGRIRLASQQNEPRQLQYHPPGIVGGMGAVAAASHLLHLDKDQLSHALGIVASRAGGLMANVGTMTKATHCGMSGAAGCEAALLAKLGFTANTEIFDAPNGYVDVFFGENFDADALLAFGQPFRLVEPGFAIKMFPSQYATHFGITAALELHNAMDDSRDITSVQVTIPIMPYVDRPVPQTGLEGKFSFQYTVAAALLDGAVTTRTFTDARRFQQDMVELLPQVTVIQSDAIPTELEHMRVEVAVENRFGQRTTATCNGPRGFWGLPRLTRQEHLVKVRDCLGTCMNSDTIERCIQRIDTLETLDSREIRELISAAGCFSEK
jgi:aconitate decarboxylase